MGGQIPAHAGALRPLSGEQQGGFDHYAAPLNTKTQRGKSVFCGPVAFWPFLASYFLRNLSVFLTIYVISVLSMVVKKRLQPAFRPFIRKAVFIFS
jgi:hypothetical protein